MSADVIARKIALRKLVIAAGGQFTPYIERLVRDAAQDVNPYRPGTVDHADVAAFRAGRHHSQQVNGIAEVW